MTRRLAIALLIAALSAVLPACVNHRTYVVVPAQVDSLDDDAWVVDAEPATPR